MSEISFQAMQLTPRFVSVVVLLALTWLVAKFTQYMVKRATSGSQVLSRLAFWAVFLIMLPFALSAAGMDTSWLYAMQQFDGQIFSYWPIWMVLSLVTAGIFFLLRGVPKLITQIKGSADASGNEI